jgi:hypothetical protein
MAPSCSLSFLKQSWRCIIIITLGHILISSLYQAQQYSNVSIVSEIIDRPGVAPELDKQPSNPRESIVSEIIDRPGEASELDSQPSQPLESIVSETIDPPHPRVFFLEHQQLIKLNHPAIQRDIDVSVGKDADEYPEYGNGADPEFDDTPCVPMKEWQTQPHPSCNKFHEIDLFQGFVQQTARKIEWLAQGGWRNVFSYEGDATYPVDDKVALKMLRWESKFVDFGPREYEIHQMDAIVTDRLTASPRIIDMYGFCAQSVFNQFADMDLGQFHREQKKKTIKDTWAQKLNLAREAALALADVHNPDAGDLDHATIAHRDLKPQNVIFVSGQLKLNDFNDAYLLKWNTTSDDRLCGFSYKAFRPKWAKGFKPREQAQHVFPLTEKIDVYALGGIIFLLLLEEKPYAGVPDEEVTDMIMQGTPPLPPEAFRNSNDPSVTFMLRVIERCYAADPADRPTARRVADQIHRAQKLTQLVNSK